MLMHALRWSVLGCSVFLLLALAAGRETSDPVRAEEPRPKPLTKEQQARLKEEGQLFTQANALYGKGQLAETARTVEKALAIERAVFGSVRAEVVPWLAFLASLYEARADFPAARQARQGVLTLHTRLHGARDWRVTDARLDLVDLERLSKLDANSRKELQQALALNQQVFRLRQQGRSREALPLARRALQIRGRLLGENHHHFAISLNNLAALHQDVELFW